MGTRGEPRLPLHMVGPHRVLQLLLHLHLDGVDGKAVRLAGLRVVEGERDLVELEAAVGRRRRASLSDALHLFGAHRLEALRDPEVVAKLVDPVHAADGRRDGKAHRVAEHLLGRENPVRDGPRFARHRLHPEHGDAALVAFGQDRLREAEEVRVVRVERELAGVPRVAARDHLHVNGGSLVPAETDEARLALRA